MVRVPPQHEGGFARQAHLHIERLRQEYAQRQGVGEEGQLQPPVAQPEAGGGAEGVAGRPLDLQQAYEGLMATLRNIIHPTAPDDNEHNDSDSNSVDDT
jgi:hypothetical protein